MYVLKLMSYFLLLIMSGVCSAAVIIQYHHVDDKSPAATSVSPAVFAEHMAYLANNGFNVWSLPRLISAVKENQALPDKVIAITFDDGYLSVLDHAMPVLQKYNFPFTVFITTELVGGRDFIGWNALRMMANKGVTIANHTQSHAHLVRILKHESKDSWERRIEHELFEAEKTIRKQIGQSPGLLAYPYGEYNTAVKKLARQLKLTAFAQHSGAFSDDVDWQAVPRFAFGGDYGEVSGFIDKVNSLPLPVTEVTVTDASATRLTEPLLPASVARPVLTLELASEKIARRLQCFASGQGALKLELNGNKISTRPGRDLAVGRSRINCTAASDHPGRYYWYSQFFMRKQDNGEWYPEQ